MKIVYFYQYFTTPAGSYSTRVYEYTKRWVQRGHDVTVVTSVYTKSDIRAKKFTEEQIIDGIKVRIINILIDNKQSIAKRIVTFLQYSFFSIYYALTLPADVVIASSGPITVGIPGLVAKYIRRRKLVFEVRDLWPDGAIELKILKNPFIIKIAYFFERMCYRAASLIVGLSPGIVEFIKNKFGFAHLVSVPNSADNELFGKEGTRDILPDFYKHKKVAIYTGNIGMVNNSLLLFNAAGELKRRGRNDIYILLIGDGQQAKELVQQKNEAGFDNFIVLDKMPKRQLAAYVQNAFVSIVPLHPSLLLNTSSPNKLFDSFAAGIPVIQTTTGWIRDLIEKNNCGFTVSATDPAELALVLIKLADDKKLATEMGMNGKRLALQEFDKLILADKMLNALELLGNVKKRNNNTQPK